MHACAHTHNHFTALLDFVRDYPGELAPESKSQEGKTNLDLLDLEIVSGSGISWAICKSAPWPGHITMPASQSDALPAAQPTASKHWRQQLMTNQLDICCSINGVCMYNVYMICVLQTLALGTRVYMHASPGKYFVNKLLIETDGSSFLTTLWPSRAVS